MIIYLLLFSYLSSNVLACSNNIGFFPANDLFIPPDKSQSNISETEFQLTLTQIENIYRPLFVQAGAELVMEMNWSDPRVNASAMRDGDKWRVIMNGGLARHRAITKDALALVACHEIGHHIGGAPLKKRTLQWSSVEGQADYFAALKCLRRLWEKDNNSQIVTSLKPPAKLKSECSGVWSNEGEASLCIRVGMAGLDIGRMLASLDRHTVTPRFENPDRSRVAATLDTHPRAQCRLDTFFQGALCPVSFHDDLSSESPLLGACHTNRGDTLGVRAACWYGGEI